MYKTLWERLVNFAEFEGRRIGTRTKTAMAAKKRRVELGIDDKAPGVIDWKKVWGFAGAAKLHPTLAGFRARGLTQRQMVIELNAVDIRTARETSLRSSDCRGGEVFLAALSW